jgi:antirestriction protein ArdC
MRRGPKRDVAQEITNLIIHAIEAGTLPWRRPWKKTGMGGAPLRAGGEPYTGINRLYLWAVADHRGHGSRYWMTYRQAQELGGQVRKGETAEHSIYFNSTRKTEIDQTSGEESSRTIRFMRAYSVFNASQIDGLPPHFYPSPVSDAPPTLSGKADAIKSFFKPIPADIRNGGDRAYYTPGGDFIQLPSPNAFRSEDGYVATMAHELGHWTGHSSRLAREFGKRFGDKAYAFEELVAEQVSARICYELGLPADLHESHASYLSHWLDILKSDKTAIITAAAKADQAFNLLAAYSGYESEPEEIAHETAPVPAAA